jgi:DNA-3-methyladenine glycosylase I
LRCEWAAGDDLLMEYHDNEWGVPVHDDRRLFEYIVLDGAQAGLSWLTVLRKRENYRRAFANFDPERVARFRSSHVRRLLSDKGIIRNRLKIEGAIRNARAFLVVQDEFGTFDEYVWRFVGGATRQNRWTSMRQIPARTNESDALSADLRNRSFSFVGSTICYAFMQAAGMVNDHVANCFRHDAVLRAGRAGAGSGPGGM